MKADFSGTYVLDRRGSTLAPGADAFESAELRIDHREPVFRCQGKFAGKDKTFEYSFELTTDGRETVNGETTSRMWWEGSALASEYRTVTTDSVVTMSWRYELHDGGRHLRAFERIEGGDHDQDNVWEFVRQA
jgi:hypothetical protein